MIGLIPAALLEHAAFAPYRAQENVVARMLASGFSGITQPDSATAQQGLREPGCEHPGYSAGDDGTVPNFIPPPARHLSAIEFERRVVEHNELIVRPDNLHDIMNALVWLTFPKTKRAISEAHVALGVTADGKTRPRRRDVLTLFDEAGIMLLSQRDDLKRLHEAHEWRALFVEKREDFVREVRPILFGHGSLEQLGSNPHRGLTVKALWLPLARDTPLLEVDTWLARKISEGAYLAATERRLPLPLLGIPGWFGENEDSHCYEDADVFRPLRTPLIANNF